MVPSHSIRAMSVKKLPIPAYGIGVRQSTTMNDIGMAVISCRTFRHDGLTSCATSRNDSFTSTRFPLRDKNELPNILCS